MNKWFHGVPALTAAGFVCVTAILLAGHFGLGPVDDAYISLRYAANWASGEGLCFNPGEKVEGYTNFLLVLIEATAIRLGADPVTSMIVIGWACLAAIAGLFALFAVRHLFPGDLVFPTLAGVLVALNPVLLCWGASGLETCLYTLLLWVSLALALGAERGVRTALAAVCLILAAMTRPEAAALLPAMLLVVFFQRRSTRQTALYGLVFLVGYGVYFAARAWYFGYLFPNTFYAKLDYGNAALLERGLGYLWSFAKAVPLLVVPALVALGLARRSPSWVWAFLLLSGAQLAVVVYEGGDHFAMFRFMAPVVPFVCALALQPFAALGRRYKQRRIAVAVVAATGLVLLGASDLMVARQEVAEGPHTITEFNRFRFESMLARHWTQMGRFLGHSASPDASMATFAIGALGFHSGLTIIDMVGVVDPVIAHQPRRAEGGAPGHDKFDNQYVLSREPGYIMLVAILTPQPWPKEAQRRVLGEKVQKVNLDMFNNPRLDQAYRFVNLRLGGGYMNFYVRRDLPDPAPPVAAE